MNDITTYSIAIGLIIYTSIYLYLLFYNGEYLSIFNKFIIYIIAIDLLLSTFYYLNNDSNKPEYNTIEQSIDDKDKPQNDQINSLIERFNESDYSDTYSDTEDSLSENDSVKNNDDDIYHENNIIESDVQLITNEPISDNIIENTNLEKTKVEDTKLQDPKLQDPKLQDPKLQDQGITQQKVDIQMEEIINTIKSVEKHDNIIEHDHIVEHDNIVEHNNNIVDHDNLASITKSDVVTFDTNTSDIITLQTTKKKRGRKPNSLKL